MLRKPNGIIWYILLMCKDPSLPGFPPPHAYHKAKQ